MISRRIVLLLLAIGLLASAYIGIRRDRHEVAARNVEIVMDDADFSALARGYNYDEAAFLTALRRAGLTSLAVSEELGANIGASPYGAVYTGNGLLDQAALSPLTDPLFARLAKTHQLRPEGVYLVAFNAATAKRYAEQLPLHFSATSIRLLRASLPAVWAIRTTSDYFSGEGFGLPLDRVLLAKRLGLLLVPRLQNDEGFTPPQLQRIVAAATRGEKARTAIFFGLRNEVLGYPAQIEPAAAALTAHHVNFGTIETYDPKQEQLGNADLARKLPERLVRVQAIAKPEADKLKPEEIIERYLLGVRTSATFASCILRPIAAFSGTVARSKLRTLRTRSKAHRGRHVRADRYERIASGVSVLANSRSRRRNRSHRSSSLAVPAIVLLILADLRHLQAPPLIDGADTSAISFC